MKRLPISFFPLEDEDQREALEMKGYFTTMTRAGTKAWPAREVALLTALEDDWEILEVGSAMRSRQRLATGWHRLMYRREVEFDPVAAADLLDAIPTRLRHSVASRLGGGALTAKGGDAVVQAVAKLRPGIAHRLKSMVEEDAARARAGLSEQGLQTAVQEADAVRLATDIFGLPKTELGGARPDGLSSFVEVLSELRVPEDTAIAYDSMRFLDFERLDHPSGVVRFSKDRENLAVVNVNRQPLERTTGADLIYINEIAQSFVLVQYKTFRREGENPSRLVYRPDDQFEAELERMRKFKVARRVDSDGAFRLYPGCCFLKICNPVASLGHDPRALVSGMYLPIDYYDLLAGSEILKGPRGGIAISYETVPRHLTNTLFVLLVRGGWIGSRGVSTRQLTDIVLAGLADGHSMTVAAASSSDEAPG